MPYNLDNKSILVTGGTGSFGSNFIKTIIKNYKPKKVIVYSRDELKQYELSQVLTEKENPIRYFLGDVRDKPRFNRACVDIDVIIHAAAMKHVPASEYNPTECIATNVLGAQNIIDGAISNGVERVIALSTDKAANPINLYGATKLCSDKLFVAANNLVGKQKTRFSVVRYGNVIGSRGSVIPHFKSIISKGLKKLPLTDKDMTRFVITLKGGIDFVIQSLNNMTGGEIFVPKLPSLKIEDLITVLVGKGNYNIIGLRPGEKLHEVMIPKEESTNCIELDTYYIIQPMLSWWDTRLLKKVIGNFGKEVKKPFEYSSDQTDNILSLEDIKNLVKKN